MVDLDGNFRYSSIIVIRKDQKGINGVMLNPNPVTNGLATARFSATVTASAEFKVIDMAGKTVLQQHAKIYPGENSVSINNIDRLQPEVFLLQMINNGDKSIFKFTVVR